MKAFSDCYPCLQRLAYQAAELATQDPELKAKATRAGLKVVEENFSYHKTTIVVAAEIHRVIKELTGNSDPYRKMKDEEVRISHDLCRKMSFKYGPDFRARLVFSALGNSIDFFRDVDAIRKDMTEPVEFMLDDVERFEEKLKNSSTILYLADNAGEVLFDIPLVKGMENYVKVTYVVKGSPVQNDITLEDIKRYGLDSDLKRVITTGTATPGVDFSSASREFKREFELADLIFAKGMGYYETLSELPAQGRIFYCLKAKCQPVADSLGVPLNSYVALLR